MAAFPHHKLSSNHQLNRGFCLSKECGCSERFLSYQISDAYQWSLTRSASALPHKLRSEQISASTVCQYIAFLLAPLFSLSHQYGGLATYSVSLIRQHTHSGSDWIVISHIARAGKEIIYTILYVCFTYKSTPFLNFVKIIRFVKNTANRVEFRFLGRKPEF